MAQIGATGNGWSSADRPPRPPALAFARRSTGGRLCGLVLAILLHVAGIWALLQFETVRSSIIEAAPIMVRFITPPKLDEPPKPVEPPKPRPVAKTPQPVRKPVDPRPVLTTKTIEFPAPLVVTDPPKPPEPAPVEARPAPPTPAAVIAPDFSAAYLHNPKPAYPHQSRRHREEGKVLLRVYVSAAGTAEKVEIQASSGWPRLDDAAQETVRSWRFVPARQADKAVPAWVVVPIKFTLEG